MQGLQLSERGLAVLVGRENREQPAAFFRQPGGFFRDHLAVVNLYFQREIAHAWSLTAGSLPCESNLRTAQLDHRLCAQPIYFAVGDFEKPLKRFRNPTATIFSAVAAA